MVALLTHKALRPFGSANRLALCLAFVSFDGSLGADVDCKRFQHETTWPDGFEWDGNAMLKPEPGKKWGGEINYYSNGACVCATRASEPKYDFPGTPDDATLSCIAEKEYRAMSPSGVN